MKNEAKKLLGTSALSSSVVNSLLVFLMMGVTLSLIFDLFSLPVPGLLRHQGWAPSGSVPCLLPLWHARCQTAEQ